MNIKQTTKVVFGREFTSKKRGEPLSRHIFQDTIFFVKWRAENFVCRLTLSQNFFHIDFLWFSENNSISGGTSLNSLRKESLD